MKMLLLSTIVLFKVSYVISLPLVDHKIKRGDDPNTLETLVQQQASIINNLQSRLTAVEAQLGEIPYVTFLSVL